MFIQNSSIMLGSTGSKHYNLQFEANPARGLSDFLVKTFDSSSQNFQSTPLTPQFNYTRTLSFRILIFFVRPL